VEVPVAALPVPYRTTEAEPSFQSLRDPADQSIPSGIPFPTALDPFTCNLYEIAEYTRAARDLGSGSGTSASAAVPAPHHVRGMAEALDRIPPASRYSADMSKHASLGSDATLRQHNLEYREQLQTKRPSLKLASVCVDFARVRRSGIERRRRRGRCRESERR
jgi:betaine-homocysteine S-methyltransferase